MRRSTMQNVAATSKSRAQSPERRKRKNTTASRPSAGRTPRRLRRSTIAARSSPAANYRATPRSAARERWGAEHAARVAPAAAGAKPDVPAPRVRLAGDAGAVSRVWRSVGDAVPRNCDSAAGAYTHSAFVQSERRVKGQANDSHQYGRFHSSQRSDSRRQRRGGRLRARGGRAGRRVGRPARVGAAGGAAALRRGRGAREGARGRVRRGGRGGRAWQVQARDRCGAGQSGEGDG